VGKRSAAAVVAIAQTLLLLRDLGQTSLTNQMTTPLYEDLQKHLDKPCLDCRDALYNKRGTQAMCEEGFKILKSILNWERSQK
jgi:hypothetical protein